MLNILHTGCTDTNNENFNTTYVQIYVTSELSVQSDAEDSVNYTEMSVAVQTEMH
jgi:hypothetical protein